MVQRCKRFSSHFFTVILSVVLIAGFGGVASGDDDHEKRGHDRSEISRDVKKSREVRLQGNVKNINARKTKFELCSDTECTKIKVSRKTSFMDVNGRASAFANLVEDDFATVVGRVRDKHHDKKKRHDDRGKRHHDRDSSHKGTVKADTVKIGFKISYLIINGVVWGLPDAAAGSFDAMDLTTGNVTCVAVPQNAEILLVANTGSTTALLLADLLSRQSVEVHGHYNDTGCFVAQTVLATAF